LAELPYLEDGPHWELRGRVDSAEFFRRLGSAFPSATTLFVEGDPDADVREFLDAVAEPGPYLAVPGTIWPKPRRHRVPISASVLATLAQIAERHAEPEICYHLHAYARERAVLVWYDAFSADAPAFVAPDVDSERVRAFAGALGFRVTKRE